MLTDAVKNEFRIKRVLFISQKKLPKIRKRLGIRERISELDPHYREIFTSADTFAVLRHSGKPDELRTKCIRIIKDELSILALSQLGYRKRRFGSYPAIKGEVNTGKTSDLFLNEEDDRLIIHHGLVGKIDSLWLERRWKNYHKKVFFYRLLKIFNDDIKVAKSWRNDLERAAILIGQSQCSTDIAQSFLWNMIALEILLTEQVDKYTDILPKRIEAFLGWVGYWEINNYEERIKEIYQKRSSFVHSGKSETISVQDLLFTDDLLLNLLSNLVYHTERFSSKKAVIDFAKKVEAEHVLGVKPKIRPKTLRFFSRSYTPQDYEKI